MDDRDCIEFLQWALPRMDLRWRGFRRVRRQVGKRISRRVRELGLADVAAYRRLLERNPAEWRRLDSLCTVTISRFWRDAGVFERLRSEVLPALAERARARGADPVRCWSAGCASGEEPYSVLLAWEHAPGRRPSPAELRVMATDADALMIERARAGRYPPSSTKALPPAWLAEHFTRVAGGHRIHDRFREAVDFRVQDLRAAVPEGPFDLVLCRNLAFTYFSEPLQRRVLAEVRARLFPGGALVLGSHESLPEGSTGLSAWPGARGVFRREPRPAPAEPAPGSQRAAGQGARPRTPADRPPGQRTAPSGRRCAGPARTPEE